MILKEDKDPTQCSSYTPISLMDVDTKIYLKILANRLKIYLSDWVHTNQAGFIPKRESRENGIRTVLIMQKMIKDRIPGLLLSIDAEKAFGRVDWDFTWGTLEELGMSLKMIHRIRKLYINPEAAIRINGNLSGTFGLQNGTRQGCPLSPLLFVLVLEPLLVRIRDNIDIKGVKIGKEEHKIAAYADDILFYVTPPGYLYQTLIKFRNIVERYLILKLIHLNLLS